MPEKPTYEELVQRVRELEKESVEYKQAEEALRRSDKKYRSMLEAMTDAVYICSPDFRIEWINQIMADRIGHDATGELCHKAINELNDKCPFCVHDKVQQVMGGRSCRNCRKSNHNCHVSIIVETAAEKFTKTTG